MSKTVEVNTPLFGVIEVDSTISTLIYDLNKAGLTTMNCCSGLIEDHPDSDWILNSNAYIQFTYKDALWKYFHDNSDFFFIANIEAYRKETLPYSGIGFYDNNITISFDDKSNEIRKNKWKSLDIFLHECIEALRIDE